MRPTITALALVLAGACRFGGPSGNPSAYIEFPDAPDDQAIPEAPEAGNDDALDGSGSSTDATAGPDTGAPEASTADGADASGDDGDATSCAVTPSVPVCNPVQNTGCFLLQCDVDMTQSTPTGQCVGGGLAAVGSTCTPASGSEVCEAQSTCFGGVCRRLCFCDSDCTGGECCADMAGTSGFHLCAPCP
jgi:hypothetical protein